MAKNNYTKVEEALAQGMLKIEVNRLLDIADKKEGRQNPPSSKPESVRKIHLQRLETLNHELKALEKAGKNPYAKLNIQKDEIKKYLTDPSVLTLQDWEKVKKMKEDLAQLKAELERKTLENSDDDLVKQQRKKQHTKRFNINEKWIPLR